MTDEPSNPAGEGDGGRPDAPGDARDAADPGGPPAALWAPLLIAVVALLLAGVRWAAG